MSYSGYVIKNCSANDLEFVCPKRWENLKPAFSDMVRHCDHCNKKVYLCETDEQIKFYSSVKFCIAVAEQEGSMNVETIPPSSTASISHAVEPAVRPDEGSWGASIVPCRTCGVGLHRPNYTKQFSMTILLTYFECSKSLTTATFRPSCENEVNKRSFKYGYQSGNELPHLPANSEWQRVRADRNRIAADRRICFQVIPRT